MPELVRASFSERFDGYYTNGMTAAVVEVAGLGRLVESWSGYALERRGAVLPFVIAGVAGNGHTNLYSSGAVRLWVKPDWSSATAGEGQGPGHVATLVELSVLGQGQTALAWTLQVSADGTAITLVGAGAKESGILLQAAIAWTAGEWHQVILNYSVQGTALIVDGEFVAEGAGLLAVSPSVTVLAVGSSLTGTESFEGELEDVFCFVSPLRAAFEYGAFKAMAARGPITAEELAYRAELAAKWKAARAQQAKKSEESGGGGMMLRLSGPSADCFTNGPVYLTNVVVSLATNDGWTIYFDVAGGTNEVVYDLFSTLTLRGRETVWTWLETALTCETHWFTNQATNQNFYTILTPGADADGDFLYDGWEWKHFGTLAQTAAGDFDGDGVSNGEAYTNLLDPNQIKFTLDFGTRYVNGNSAAGTVLVSQGVPEQMALLVNSTNFEGAVWEPYQSNVTASLGATNGEYTVWVGLQGHAWDTLRTWHGVTITRDTVAPLLYVTQPLSNLTAQPLIQLQGYANEPLLSVRYDLTNAAGLQTNLAGYVTQQVLDTNTLKFTTNWFQCYDVALETNLNTLTVRVTDLAGNVTSTNLNLTLDYSSDTNAPAIAVTWPEDNALVAGTNFTVRGQLDDGTASVVMNLGANSIAGAVDRNGYFEIPGVPLEAATNTLTLITTDAAGNRHTNTHTVRHSSETLTVNPVSPSQLTGPTVTVSGTVGVSDQNVWVNGTAANVSGTDWLVNLATPPDNVANFDVVTGPTLANPTAMQNFSIESPPQVRPVGYTEKFYVGQTGGCGAGWMVLADSSRSWTPVNGTFASLGVAAWLNVDAGQNYSETHYDELCFGNYTSHSRRSFQAQTKTELQVGGRGGTGETRLLRLLVTAASYADESLIGLLAGDVPLLAAGLQLFGQTVTPTATNAYVGELFIEQPAGATIDLPVTITGATSASFNVNVEDSKLKIYFGTNTTDIAGQTNEVIVGQKISLRCELSHPNTVLSNFQWTIPGFAISNYVADANASIVYSNFPTTLSNVAFFWVDGGPKQVECSAVINGSTIRAKTKFEVIRPSATIHATTGTLVLDTNMVTVISNACFLTLGLHYGNPSGLCGGTPGIAFSNTLTIPNGFTGQIQWVQMITSVSLRYQANTPEGSWVSLRATNMLDTFYPYSSQNTAEDSPGANIDPPFCLSQRLSDARTFGMWLLYKPTSGPSGGIDGQWVPLRKVAWGYSGEALLVATNCSPTSWSGTNFTTIPNPSDAETYQYPQWTNNIANFGLQPE